MKVGIKGQSFSGREVWAYFERVPGAKVPQVRITMDNQQVYLEESSFTQMIVDLFASGETIEYRHAKRETR